MPGRRLFEMRTGAGVDDDHSIGMLDRESVDRNIFDPFAWKQWLQLPPEAVPAALDLRLFDRHAAGLDCVDPHDVLHDACDCDSAPADAAEMGVAERGRIFEAVAKRAVDANMRDQNQTRARERGQGAEKSRE